MSDFVNAVGSTFVWHELYAPDAEAARQFYVNALGWGTKDMDMGEMGNYPMLVANGEAVAGVMSTASMEMQGVPPQWSVYFAVDDVDARLAKCKELGGSCMVEPMDIPGVGRMALIKDPQGATFWLFKPSSPAG